MMLRTKERGAKEGGRETSKALLSADETFVAAADPSQEKLRNFGPD
jgi:hypothetical protein